MRLTRYVCVSVFLLGSVARPAASATLTVCASGCAYNDVQAAVDAALPGDTILLRAGETFVGHVVLPNKPNATGSYITIRSDAPASALPAAGTRLVPAGKPGANTALSALARLKGRGGQWKTTPVIAAAAGAHHYRLQFLDIDGVSQEGWSTLLMLGTIGASQSTLASVPYAITLDRLYIHGHAVKGQKRCVALNGSAMDILDSYISGCASFSSDAQAIGGFNGPGPFRIINNYLEGSGENVMFGGADPTITGLIPSDIEIRRNLIAKPVSWKSPILAPPAAPSLAAVSGAGTLAAGTHYFTVVALLDAQGEVAVSAPSAERAIALSSSGSAVKLTWTAVRGADRYRIYRGTTSKGENRYLEAGAVTSFTYTGSGELSATPRADGTRWTVKNLLELKSAQRVVIDGNVFEDVWAANQKGYAIQFTVRNQDGGAPWTVIRDVMFSNNTIRRATAAINILGSDDLHPSQLTERITIRNNLVYDVDTHFLLITRGPRDVHVDHNTVFHGDKLILVDDGQCTGFVFTNNVGPHNTYGIFGSGAGFGNTAIATYFPNSVFRRNAIGGAPASSYPPDNFYPDMATFNAQFVAPGSDDYHLVSSSIFHAAGTDGHDLGVDFAALATAQAGGSSSSSGSTPYRGARVTIPGTIEAEDFDDGGAEVAYHDTTVGNSGGKYRSTDVDIEGASDSGGGYDVGWMAVGEWLKYSASVGATGTYDLEFRLASNGGGGSFHLDVNGTNKTGPIGIPNTGGWQTWTTVRKTGVALNAGDQTWRLVIDQAGASGATANMNFIRVTSASSSTAGSDIVLYASDVSRMAGNWARVSSTNAAGGQAMQSVDHGWSSPDTPRAAPADYFEMTFTPEANRDYRIWVRLRAQADSKWNDSIWVQFSGAVDAAGAPRWPIGSASALAVNLEACSGCGVSGWGWQNRAYWLTDQPVVRFASNTPQTLRIQTREDGAQVDQVVLSPVTYFSRSPGGTKNDTTIVAKASVSSTPISADSDIVLYTSNVTRLAGNWARRSSTSAAGGEMLASADAGWSAPDAPQAAPANYVEMQFAAVAGQRYRVWLRLSAAGNSKWNDSVWVQFSGAINGSGAALWRIGSTSGLAVNLEDCFGCGVSGWGWQDNAWWMGDSSVVQFAASGTQTLRIQTREDGVQIDQVVLSPVTYFTAPPGAVKADATIVPR